MGASKLDELTERLDSIKAKDLMTADVITTTEDTNLADIAEFMITKRISGLPVVDEGGSLKGTITADDLFILMDMIKSGDIVEKGEKGVFNPTVKFALSEKIIRIEPSTTLNEIIGVMKNKNAHTLPVFEEEKMVGVIGRRDVFKKFYSIVKELYR